MRKRMGLTSDGISGKAARIPQFEQLEPRLLLDADLVGTSPLSVTAVTPLPGSVLHEVPAQIQVDFSESLDSASLNENTFRLRASGGDGTFQDGNERVVTPAGIVVDGGTRAIMDLAGVALADDAYEVTLIGDAAWISDRDAELMSMEISGALLPPPELYEQIRADLDAIRAAYPAMTSIRHRPKWVPGGLLVGLTEEAMAQFRQGEYHGLDALNNQYGPVTMTPFQLIDALHLKFAQPYNPEYLAPLYGAAEGVRYAHPNGLIGDGDTITVSGSPLAPPARYTFERGWGDCPAGCISRHYWVFEVSGGSVTLVGESGDPLPDPLAPAIITDLEGDPLNGGRDEVFAFTLDATPPSARPVYRFWSPVLSRHFYTISEGEKDKLIHNYSNVWTYEGVAYSAFADDAQPGVSPVYRFWSGTLRTHFYTMSRSERDKLILFHPRAWTYEGVAFYAYAAGVQPAGTSAVYRFWSGTLGCHFHTISPAERDNLLDLYLHVWTYEKIAWYAYGA